ncbi:MAG: single-stranded DNA-binding protein [Treponema sp.]|nr:single-stranded DNA-binding protein [Treponema sp.]
MSNSLTVHGRLTRDAESYLVKIGEKESTMVSFPLIDSGLPGHKGETFVIEVHFVKEIAKSILPYLVKGKEVIVHGFLAQKNYVTSSGESRSKLYVSANIVEFVGKGQVEEVDEASGGLAA